MATKKTGADSASLGAYLLLALIVLAMAAGALALIRSVIAKEAAAEALKQQVAQNERLGLPPDYPWDVVPLYDGSTPTTSEKLQARSTTGEPMDQWHVHAETDEDKQVVYDHYNKLLMDKGFAQSFFGSVPNGRTATYRNETTEIQLVVEKKKADKRTQIDIKLFRLSEAD